MIELEVTDQPAEADVAALLAGLTAGNEAFLGKREVQALAVIARSGGELLGGIKGVTNRGFLHVDLLWVAEGYRRAGLGSRLLLVAETEARRRGCHSARLDTYDFQARPFYERHGYQVFGELTGFPRGHRSFYLVKRFGPAGDG